MKIKSTFFLLLFVGFLLAPVVIHFCNEQADVTVFFSMNEEENVDTSFADSEKLTQNTTSIPVHQYGLNTKVFPVSYNVAFWDALYLDTSSPPPQV